MNSITTNYLLRAETWLFITTLVFFVMNGAQIYETVVIIPKWTKSPPESLQILQGKYGLDLKTFWFTIHSVHEITFILAIAFCWKIGFIANWLMMLFALHIAVRAWTILYFAPNVIEFQKTVYAEVEGPALLKRTTLWRSWNYLRVGLSISLSLGLIPICLQLLRLKC
jgi:hypothetical protein